MAFPAERARAALVRPPLLTSLDAGAAVALSAGALATLSTIHSQSPVALSVVAVVACTSTVGWRRNTPVVAALVALSAMLVYQRLTHDPQNAFPSIVVALDMYMVGRKTRRNAICGAAAVAGYALLVALLVGSGTPGSSIGAVFVAWIPMAIVPMAVGVGVARRVEMSAELSGAIEQLREEQRASSGRAAAEERNRVARELHDVLAHSITVMVIQAGAARRLVTDDTSRAADALRSVADLGREAMGEIRGLVGALHRSDGNLASAPYSHRSVEQIVERMRQAGLPVTMEFDGCERTLTPDVGLAVHRMLQESLTNVMKHAGLAKTRVAVHSGPDELELRVTNEPGVDAANQALSGSGHGLIGIGERAAMYGGTSCAAPTPDGGFDVRIRLPVVAPHHGVVSPRAREPSAAPSPDRSWWPAAIVAAVVFAALESEVARSAGYGGGAVVRNTLIVGAMAVALLWRRQWPLAFLVTVCAGSVLLSHSLVPLDSATLIGTYVALVPTYTVSAYGNLRTASAGLLFWMIGVSVVGWMTHARLGGLFGAAGAAGLAWVAGRIVHNQRDVSDRLARTNAEILNEREARIELAVAHERGRIARDLGTLVGELISSMVVQSQAALGALDRADDRLPGMIALAEDTGREALTKTRLILGVLRRPETTPGPKMVNSTRSEPSASIQELFGAVSE